MVKEGKKKVCLEVCSYPCVCVCASVCVCVYVLAVFYLRLPAPDREPITVVALARLALRKRWPHDQGSAGQEPNKVTHTLCRLGA